MPHFLLRAASPTILMLLLTGCITTQQGVTNIFNRSGGSTAETIPGKVIDTPGTYREPGTITGDQRTLGDAGTIASIDRLPNGKPLEDYLQSIAARLLKAYDGYKPPISVVVSTSEYMQSATAHSKDNIVEIPQGTFLNVSSEDELAFSVAHEISHLLLNHGAKDVEDKARKELRGSSFAVGATLTAVATQGKGRSAMQTMLVAFKVADLADESINKAWTRTQEDMADLLAIDLMVKAGFNWEESLKTLERLQSAKEARKTEIEAQQKSIETEINNLVGAGKFDKGLDLMLKQAVDTPFKAIEKLWEDAESTHPEPRDRYYNVGLYMQREYIEGLPPKPSTAAFKEIVFKGKGFESLSRHVLFKYAQERQEKGDYDSAIDIYQQLIKAIKEQQVVNGVKVQLASAYILRAGTEDGAKAVRLLSEVIQQRGPEVAHLMLMTYYVDQQQWGPARAALEQYAKAFPARENDLLPSRVRIAYGNNRTTEAEAALTRCRSTQLQDLINKCDAAAKAAGAV